MLTLGQFHACSCQHFVLRTQQSAVSALLTISLANDCIHQCAACLHHDGGDELCAVEHVHTAVMHMTARFSSMLPVPTRSALVPACLHRRPWPV
jgi:hypothetical protein